jgi:hypothetical protein
MIKQRFQWLPRWIRLPSTTFNTNGVRWRNLDEGGYATPWRRQWRRLVVCPLIGHRPYGVYSWKHGLCYRCGSRI